MEIYNLSTMKREERAVSPLSPESGRGFAVALGSFDGIHAGHVALLTRAVSAARERGLCSAVWTFRDDASQLPGKRGTRVITTLKEKLGLIASLGVDYALLEDFSRVRDYSPEYFVNRLLKQDSHMRLAVCGFNFRFGKDRLGDSDTLGELMGSENCIIVPPVYRSGHLVSSSAIRLLISAGEMEQAAELLTRPFFIDFPVVHGKQLGRTIGIPTINQEFPEGHVIPKNGIYACTVEIADDIFLGVANVGVRPTVDHSSAHINCETHIINYNGWLYGKNIKVSFYKRIRDEIKFPSVDELRAQIKRDIASAIDYFSKK